MLPKPGGKAMNIKIWNLLLMLIFSAVIITGLMISCGDDDDDDDDSSSGDDDDDDNDTTGDDDDDDDDTVSADVWTDTVSGLMWTKEVEQQITWQNGVNFCDTLSLGGFDDWRTPTINELRSLIVDCESTMTDGICGVTDECLSSDCGTVDCQGCELGHGPNEGCFWSTELGGTCNWLWTISEVSDETARVWVINFEYGMVSTSQKVYGDGGLRCVR